MKNMIQKTLSLVLTMIMLAVFVVPTNLANASGGLKAPFECGKTFTVTGTHDRAGGRHALDFGMAGQNVLAMRSGTIVFAGWDKTGGGNMIKISHGDGTFALYLHLATFKKTSGKVNQGDAIAVSGNTGNGVYHLHVSVTDNNGRELPMVFDETGAELSYQSSLTSKNGTCGSCQIYVFGPGSWSSLTQDQNWGRANLTIHSDCMVGHTVYVRFFRNGRVWEYSQKATSNNITFWNLDGAGPLNRNTTYYTQVALDQKPNPSWPIPCAGPSGGQGLCDKIYRP